ncbi:MAG: protein translocase subunit SecD [Oscillospiraceae bacterium]|nr:protein translocase subunit SecD [Oscillospiraceae bacterium]
MKRLANFKGTVISVILITLLISYVAFFGVDIGSMHLKGAPDMRFGIDIKGGIDAAFVPKDLDRQPTASELEAARAVIETRLDQKNILDRDVTIDKDAGCIFVRFPWKSSETDFDPEKAIAELGSMALLTFKDPNGNIVMEGKHVNNAKAETDREMPGNYLVQLTLKPEGRQMFAEATERLVGQTISIYLDEDRISAPTVKSRIDSEQCVISGTFTAYEAKILADQINSGSLPFALITENYSTISPELGSNALNVMVQAGIVAFVLVCLALMLYYRLSGVIAAVSLLLQVTGQIILLTWPQFSITLPGIAGIILSIGMGVDANVITSERIREELQSGKSFMYAVSSGFKMAFSSIFDGNITVLIVSFVMMIFGSGAILSFAYTLLFGIIMNFVAGVTATKLMTVSIAQYKWAKKPSLFLSKRAQGKSEVKVYPFFRHRKIYYAISACIMLVGIIMTFANGIILDIQFRGGAILKYAMSEAIELDPNDAANLVEQTLGGQLTTGQITTDFATGEMRLVLNIAGNRAMSNEELQQVSEVLKEKYPEQEFELDSTNIVSPFFGEKFLRNAIISIGLSSVLIILYVWYSFRKIHGLSAGFMSLVALLHDVLVAFFTFIIFRIPIGDSFVAVALAILGYSVNDTIVIYDRIRENASDNTGENKKASLEEIVDKSISQSFTRSLNTNLAVFVSIAILYVFALLNGLDSIVSFALPMAIGSISGCYSTICLVCPLWCSWENRSGKRVKKIATIE